MITEINLLGTGGGYGESIVIGINNDDFIIVDSCYNPTTSEVLPLAFMKSKSINPDQVKLIICTHWHDDHIIGLSKILKECTNSLFSFAKVNDLQKFLRLISIDFQKITSSSTSNSSTVEFNECLNICRDRNIQIKYSNPDRLLFSKAYGEVNFQLYSLSPSDFSTDIFDQEISTLIEKCAARNIKIINQTPNDRSVALLLEIGKYRALLGADLEVKTDRKLGWLDVVENSSLTSTTAKGSYFKIPHHGSENGYHDEIWSKLLTDKPIGCLTPYNRKVKLPTERMLDKYKALTKEIFITSDRYLSKKPKKRDKKISKTIKQFNDTLHEIKYVYGVITSYIDATEPEPTWTTSIEGSACRIS